MPDFDGMAVSHGNDMGSAAGTITYLCRGSGGPKIYKLDINKFKFNT